MNADNQLVKQLQNGYRMGKPILAPNPIGEMMNDCWKQEPNERPTFAQLEKSIGSHLELSISSYYLDLNSSYVRLDETLKSAPMS